MKNNSVNDKLFEKRDIGMSENSYIYIEQDLIYIQCEECYKKNKLGSFWPACNGYGNSVHCKCGKTIHEEKENSKNGNKK